MTFCSDTDDKILLTYLCWLNLTLLTSWFLSFVFVSLSIRSLTSLLVSIFFLLRFDMHSCLFVFTCQFQHFYLCVFCLFLPFFLSHSVWVLSFSISLSYFNLKFIFTSLLFLPLCFYFLIFDHCHCVTCSNLKKMQLFSRFD